MAAKICACALSLLLLCVTLTNALAVPQVQAAASWGVAAYASCSALARLDPSATNGPVWGRTLLAGHNAPGGWFGVDVCGNGVNASAPDGANVSCDRLPDNWAKTGCAPGAATSDGYGLAFQCVELVIRFSAWAYGDNVSDWGRSGYGNAPDLWLPANHPSDFIMYPNGSTHAPVPGDILVWGEVNAQGQPWPAGADGAHGGHIAVVAAVHDGDVITAEQNVKWGNEDHPSDTLALNKVGSRWILSGSGRPATQLPTFRWQSTMGTTRATYGWLHNLHNKGSFPANNAHAVTKPTKPTKTATPTSSAATPAAPQRPSGGLPSLADSAVITADGTLADLSWSTMDLFSTSTTSAQAPSADVRSLGAPPGTHLIANQSVSIVALPDGTRYCYAVAADGNLYSARTAPDLFGVQWTQLGAPEGVQLQPTTAAGGYAGGVGVVALGADGNLWWRAGPASSPGGWLPAGHPDVTSLAGSFALVGQPGSGEPLLLALGANGRVYERIWQPASTSGDGSVEVPAGWSDWLAIHAQEAAVHLAGKLALVPELVSTRSWVGAWPDVPLDLVAADTLGNLWRLRLAGASTGWTLSPIESPHVVTALLGAVAIPHAATGKPAQPISELHLYVATVAGPYLATVDLPPAGSTQASTSTTADTVGNAKPTWTALAPMPQGLTSAAAGAALDLGTDASALVVTMGDGVLAGGVSDATSALLATDTVAVSAPDATRNAWLSVGTVSGASPFADALTSTAVDRRWYLAGKGAAALPATGGLRLAAGSTGAAALLQSAPNGEPSVQVQVAVPQTGGANVSGGLLLYLDGSDWLTLTVNGAGKLSLCATARQLAAPCQAIALKRVLVDSTLWLRVTRSNGSFTGAYSTDAQTWTTLASWSVPAAAATNSAAPATSAVPGTPEPTASARRAATATALVSPSVSPSVASIQPGPAADVASLAFTQWGLYVAGTANTGSLPMFRNFTISPQAAGQ